MLSYLIHRTHWPNLTLSLAVACDLKEIYPEKSVTLIHSRDHIMPVYHEKLSDMIKQRFQELGVEYVAY